MQDLTARDPGGPWQTDREGNISPATVAGLIGHGMRAISEQSRCAFPSCFHEVKILNSEWLALRKYARELDLNNGSYYDARIGAVCFWCGPDNKPLDWPDVEIENGTLRFPRDYVGAIHASGLGRRKITLHFRVYAYTRGQVAGVERTSPEYQQLVSGTIEDQKWIVHQFELLRHHVALMRKASSR